MTVTLVFQCGHRQDWSEGQPARCQVCGSQVVARTLAPAPTFRGECVSPLKKESAHG